LKIHKDTNSLQKYFSWKYSKSILLTFVFFTVGIAVGLSGLPGYVKANFFVLNSLKLVNLLTVFNDLEDIDVQISAKNVNQLNLIRETALKNNQLSSNINRFVPAKISFRGNTYEAKVRIKGDLSDHWDSDKVSYRIKLKDDRNILGMTEFSVQQPNTRENTNQWLFLETLRLEKLLAVEYKFINLSVNGKSHGIYAMEECFTKEFIESKNRRDGVVVSFDEELYWEKYLNQNNTISWEDVYKSSKLNVRDQSRVVSSEYLNQQKDLAFRLLNDLRIKNTSADKVFDAEKLGKFLAICRIWNAEHALMLQNINFYLNPMTCLLEPIGFDGMPGTDLEAPYSLFDGGRIKNSWFNQALQSNEIAKQYVKHLNMYSDISFVEKLTNSLKDKDDFYRTLLLRNLIFGSASDIWSSDKSLLRCNIWDILYNRCELIQKELNASIPLIVEAEMLEDSLDIMKVYLENLLNKPVEIHGIKFLNNDEIEEIPSNKFNDINSTITISGTNFSKIDNSLLFQVDLSEYNSSQVGNIFIVVSKLGNKNLKQIETSVIKSGIKLNQLPLNGFNSENFKDILQVVGEEIIFKSGVHQIDKSINIPHGYTVFIPPGTTLKFSLNTYFCTGSAIHANGKKDNPIVFTSAGEWWPGLLLLNAQEVSIFQNVEFSNTVGVGNHFNLKGTNRSGWNLTGGITMLNTNMEFLDCRFVSSHAEDALNVFNSNFELKGCQFLKSASDAFDSDFSKGKISLCLFRDIGGDALDFSGSETTILDTNCSNIEDKCISVGEKSVVKVFRSQLRNSSFGIVSKDNSQVIADNISISDAKIADLAAFQKKNIFGPAKILISNLKSKNTIKLAMPQSRSKITIDDVDFPTENYSALDLYQEQ